MELSQQQSMSLLKRFPEFELSYETISHKKVSTEYNLAVAVPNGKKVFAWFTFQERNDVCYLLDINKDKKLVKATLVKDLVFDTKLSLGTVLYGTLLLEEATGIQRFIIEDIYFYQGIPLKNANYGEKLCFLQQYMEKTPNVANFLFLLPMMWEILLTDGQELPSTIPEEISKIIGYAPHHIQYRPTSVIMPYLNVFLTRKLNIAHLPAESKKVSSHKFEVVPISMDFSKPQYRFPTVFQVTADIQFDIYHLFTFGKNKIPVYYNVAYVPNYKSSCFLNGVFRKIRENKNLDYIEESDDEDDFQNIDEDKYVDINKVVLMECVFQQKFKRWIPVKIVDNNSRVVHMSKLARNYY
jgi:hypothetical protein